jgi:hypothetical protein
MNGQCRHKISANVPRLKAIYWDAAATFRERGGYTVEEAEAALESIERLINHPLRHSIRRAKECVAGTLIGSNVEVQRPFHESNVSGTVVSDDAEQIEVEVEPGFTLKASWDWDREQWVSYSHPRRAPEVPKVGESIDVLYSGYISVECVSHDDDDDTINVRMPNGDVVIAEWEGFTWEVHD